MINNNLDDCVHRRQRGSLVEYYWPFEITRKTINQRDLERDANRRVPRRILL